MDEEKEIGKTIQEKDDVEKEIQVIEQKQKGFLGNLAKKADEIKRQSIDLGKMAAREAGELGEKIEDTVEDGIDATKKLKSYTAAKNEILDLLERLAKLKEHGVITEEEFTAKKKELLEKI